MNQSNSLGKNVLNWIIPASIFLLIVFFLPNYQNSPYSVKVALFASLSIIALVILLFGFLQKGVVEIPKTRFILPLIVVPIIATVSAFFTGAFVKSFFGSGIEINTAIFWILGVLFLIVTSLSINSMRQVYSSAAGLIAGVAILLLALFLKILAANGGLPSALVSFMPDSLAVTITDAVILSGAATIIAFHALSITSLNRYLRIVLWVIMAASLLLLGALNFKLVTILLAIFSFIHFVYSVSVSRLSQGDSVNTKVPVASLFVLVVSVVLLFGGSSLSGVLSNTFKISNFDVRPTLGTTITLVGEGWKANPVLGVGPNKFSNLWNYAKPASVNSSEFWSVNFSNGFSFLLTSAAEMGPLGALAILVFLALFLYTGFRSIFFPFENLTKRSIIISLFFASLYFWIIALLYSPNIAVLAVTFILTGIFAGSLSVSGVLGRVSFNIFANPRSNFFSVFVIVVLVIAGAASLYTVFQRIVASTYFNKAVISINNGDADGALVSLVKATTIASSDMYWQAVSNIYTGKLQTALDKANSNSGNIDDASKKEIQALVGSAVASANNAISLDKKNYINWVYLGQVYEILARNGVEGAAVNAVNAYNQAKTVAPSNPLIPLSLARLDVVAGKLDEALKKIDQALILKPNLVDAYFLKAQIEASKGNVEAAIKSVENATIVDPTNTGLYFQLGLLKYNTKDYLGSAKAMENAIRVTPDYANAKYFLGLSYEQLGRRPEAIVLFEDIEKTNPDSAEIKFILSNLKAGKSPFTNVKPPLDNKPEKRETPPIK